MLHVSLPPVFSTLPSELPGIKDIKLKSAYNPYTEPSMVCDNFVHHTPQLAPNTTLLTLTMSLRQCYGSQRWPTVAAY
jgi:hypothetical protein